MMEKILTIIAALGGWTLIQYFLDWFRTRRSSKAKDCAESFNNQFSMYKDQIIFLNDQLKVMGEQLKSLNEQLDERDDRITALSMKIKEMDKSINDLIKENQDFKNKMCLKYDCTSREK